ncbi:ribosome-inactivating protein SNAIf-like [Momordica charantia]|uniref:Ribosome-inactivating protein SNAIf-like n=1 Tax=Momordica charantia TaxID=3673 RepID=A0A6J1D7U5_MOMCH|nr:ribosome-inactivating protein SNAIf-like [Momordica charantia]
MGQDGLCLDSDGTSRYNFPKLVPCNPKEERQVWNIVDDGTIHWTNDRCLFPYGKKVTGQYFLVKTGMCDELTQQEKTWSLNNNPNTISHVDSGLVLTVKNYTKTLTVVPYKSNNPSQIWAIQEAPRVGLIMGLHNYKCLWSDGPHRSGQVFVHDCLAGTWFNQVWALFHDGSIRLESDRSLCLTSSSGAAPYFFVDVFKCEDKAEQRWVVETDGGAIHHPGSDLVMDVIPMSNQPQPVVLFSQNGATTQQWTFMHL